MRTRQNDLSNHNLTPHILSHPDAPALLQAMIFMGLNVDRLTADTKIVHQSSDEVIASVSDHVMGDIVIDSGHDPPLLEVQPYSIKTIHNKEE